MLSLEVYPRKAAFTRITVAQVPWNPLPSTPPRRGEAQEPFQVERQDRSSSSSFWVTDLCRWFRHSSRSTSFSKESSVRLRCKLLVEALSKLWHVLARLEWRLECNSKGCTGASRGSAWLALLGPPASADCRGLVTAVPPEWPRSQAAPEPRTGGSFSALGASGATPTHSPLSCWWPSTVVGTAELAQAAPLCPRKPPAAKSEGPRTSVWMSSSELTWVCNGGTFRGRDCRRCCLRLEEPVSR
mmetsp:Transcript_25027/g.78862  ORF Transcript_25027/g.78862 Transcript_25027/m.78862 type:complete len:243 (-) Transcript_25027:125-853(-)